MQQRKANIKAEEGRERGQVGNMPTIVTDTEVKVAEIGDRNNSNKVSVKLNFFLLTIHLRYTYSGLGLSRYTYLIPINLYSFLTHLSSP